MLQTAAFGRSVLSNAQAYRGNKHYALPLQKHSCHLQKRSALQLYLVLISLVPPYITLLQYEVRAKTTSSSADRD
jgi:hypothetical protein